MNQARLRRLNEHPIQRGGEFVLYWMQMYRRFEANHALDYACVCAHELGLPLVVYEGLRLDYPWASARHHRFILDGMHDNIATAEKLGVDYWPFVETPTQPARGVLKRVAARAALVVTDDFPCFIVPAQSRALAQKIDVAMYAVDGNGIVPLSLLGPSPQAAAHLRPRVQKAFAEAWAHQAKVKPALPPRRAIAPSFELYRPQPLDEFVRALPIDQTVSVLPVRGGSRAAKAQLKSFVAQKLPGYAEHRSKPASPEAGFASGLSPYLHYGHIGIQTVVDAVLHTAPDFSPEALGARRRGRQGFYSADENVSSFLDEAITWRDVGFLWHWRRGEDAASLDTALPRWAFESLQKHRADARSWRYDLATFEAGQTHDPLWNAAQHELVATGAIHNYLRMLWGKKVLEWSESPAAAYRTLEHLNHKYALDGRDPNSYTGILWCFGLYDRPWPPERPIYGNVRYMSSDNTAKKFKLGDYLRYVATLSETGR